MTEWERSKAWIEAALIFSGGTHAIEDVERGIAERKMMLISGKRSALVFMLIEAPRIKTFHIFLAGGDLSELRSLNGFLDELAKAYSCKRITIAGRGGWARELRDLGYVARSVLLAKDL